MEAQDPGYQCPCGHAPVLAATASLRALAGPETAAKSVRTCPRALGPPLREAGRSPKYHTWRAGRGGPRGLHGYLYGPPRLVLPAWSRPGISILLAQPVWWWSWVPPGWSGPGRVRKALGVEKGGEGEAFVSGRLKQRGASCKGAAAITGTPYSAPQRHWDALQCSRKERGTCRAGERCWTRRKSLGTKSRGARAGGFRSPGQWRGGGGHRPFSAPVELRAEVGTAPLSERKPSSTQERALGGGSVPFSPVGVGGKPRRGTGPQNLYRSVN